MNRISEDKNVRKHDILTEDIVHYRHCYKCKKSGFTLAEMMVVMLILSIVLAAMAPVMTTRNKTDYSSPWRYASNGSDAYFAGNSNSNQVAMIGQHEVGTGENNARLILRTSSGSGWSHLMFKTGDTIVGRLYLDENNLYLSNNNNPSGTQNTSVGVDALSKNTGNSNTAIGNKALEANTSGESNISVGVASLLSNTTGSGNVAIGNNTLQHNTIGGDNIALGTNANSGDFTRHIYKTIAIGNQTAAYETGAIAIGSSLTSSEGGTAYNGAYASGKRSTAIGNGSSSTGTDTLAIGSYTEADNEYAIAIGNRAKSLGGLAIAIGPQYTQSYGENSIAIGRSAKAGLEDQDLNDNIAIGTSSLSTNESTIAIGPSASVTEEYGIAIGQLASVNAKYGIAIGQGAKVAAPNNLETTSNIAIGHNAMGSGARAFKSIAIGEEALYYGGGQINDFGYNIAIGYQAGKGIKSANNNTAIGAFSMTGSDGYITLGGNNTAIGADSCRYVAGSNKTCIGYNSGPKSGSDWASAEDTEERIFIGSQSKFDGGTAVLEVHNTTEDEGTLNDYGDINKTAVVVHGALVVTGPIYNLAKNKGTGNKKKMWGMIEFDGTALHQGGQRDFNNNANHYVDYTNDDVVKSYDSFKGDWSDRRLKYVGKENKAGLDKIRQLKVFNYTFKKDEKKTPHVGVIAQDLQKVFPDAVKKGVDGFLTIRMEDMFYAVINAIKELDSRVTKLEKENQELEARIERLEAKVK